MKKILLVSFLCVFGTINWTSGRVLIMPHEMIEMCTKLYSNDTIQVVDYSNVQIHLENDTHTFIDGTAVMNMDIEKISGEAFTEHYDRGQWTNRVFNRKYSDMCKALHDPLQPSYEYTKQYPKCPLKKGDAFVYNMFPITFPERVLEGIPPHYWGPWRGTIIFRYVTPDGTTITNCLRIHADIHDDPRPKSSLPLGQFGG